MTPTDPRQPAGDDRPDALADRPDPVSDVRSDDDRDLGWGEDLDPADRDRRDARWYEEQRPPHWE